VTDSKPPFLHFADMLARWCAWPGRVLSWLTVIILALVLGFILLSALRLNLLFDWGFAIPLFGERLMLNGVGELQWHLFGVMVLMGAPFVLFENGNVRVDFIYGNLKPRTQKIIDIIGNIVFLLPFVAILFWFSLGFVERSFLSGEQSDYGGLIDRYLIKSVFPVAYGLLFLQGILQIIRDIGAVALGHYEVDPDDAAAGLVDQHGDPIAHGGAPD